MTSSCEVTCVFTGVSHSSLFPPSLHHVARRQQNMGKAGTEVWAVPRPGVHGRLGFCSYLSPCMASYISCLGVRKDTTWGNMLSSWKWLLWRIMFWKVSHFRRFIKFPPWPSLGPLLGFLFQPLRIRLLLNIFRLICSRGRCPSIWSTASDRKTYISQVVLRVTSVPLLTEAISSEPCVLNVSSFLHSERIHFCELVFYTSIYTSTFPTSFQHSKNGLHDLISSACCCLFFKIVFKELKMGRGWPGWDAGRNLHLQLKMQNNEKVSG